MLGVAVAPQQSPRSSRVPRRPESTEIAAKWLHKLDITVFRRANLTTRGGGHRAWLAHRDALACRPRPRPKTVEPRTSAKKLKHVDKVLLHRVWTQGHQDLMGWHRRAGTGRCPRSESTPSLVSHRGLLKGRSPQPRRCLQTPDTKTGTTPD